MVNKMQQKHDKLRHNKANRLQRFFSIEVWPLIPKTKQGRRLSRQEEDDLLGYGPAGV